MIPKLLRKILNNEKNLLALPEQSEIKPKRVSAKLHFVNAKVSVIRKTKETQFDKNIFEVHPKYFSISYYWLLGKTYFKYTVSSSVLFELDRKDQKFIEYFQMNLLNLKKEKQNPIQKQTYKKTLKLVKLEDQIEVFWVIFAIDNTK